jgi:hypothetical protein
MSSKVVASVNIAALCSPMQLNITCDDTSPSNFKVALSSDAIVVDRRGITHLGDMTFCIDKPLYIGCTEIDFSKHLATEDTMVGQIQELDGTGAPINSPITVPIEVVTVNNEYKLVYKLKLNPEDENGPLLTTGYLSICEFTHCKFILNLEYDLTAVGGFELCEVPDINCDFSCGGLTICGTLPQWELKDPTTPIDWDGTLALPLTVATSNGNICFNNFAVEFADEVLDGSEFRTIPIQLIAGAHTLTCLSDGSTQDLNVTVITNVTTLQPPALPLTSGETYTFTMTYTELDRNGDPCPNTLQVPFTIIAP